MATAMLMETSNGRALYGFAGKESKLNRFENTHGSFNPGEIAPLLPYSESLGADPKILRRQASRYGALVQRGGIDFIDLPAFDAGQRAELEEKNRAKAINKAKGKKSSGSIETTKAVGLLHALYNKLQRSIPQKESELREFSTRIDRETDSIEKKSLSRKRDRKQRDLDRSRETLARVEARLRELAVDEDNENGKGGVAV